MIDKDWLFVLGAQDPEMREIERVLKRADRRFAHAAKTGTRCSARNAYEADSVALVGADQRVRPVVLAPVQPAVMVECGLPGHPPVLRVDHHHPGDPGYERAAHAYLEGSSLGQVLGLLEMEASETQRLLAAGDHCLTAAYQGLCPGVDPNELLFLRAAWRAKISGRSLGDVVEGILQAAKLVRRHLHGDRLESVFLDPTEVPADLPEGAAYAGCAVRYRALDLRGELKEMLKGADPARIEAFMREHQAAGRKVYGNPHRGYAGAYLG
jgi:hypothetical protein